MYRKNNTLAAALFEEDDGKHAPFFDNLLKVSDNIILLKKESKNNKVYEPMYIHSFRFITPKKVSEVQKFMLKFPTPDTITEVADKLRYYRYKRGLYQIDIADREQK